MTPVAPTHTENWLRCPVFAHLHRDGWEPRGLWTPNRLLGSAIGDGLTAHYRTLRGDAPQSPQEALEATILGEVIRIYGRAQRVQEQPDPTQCNGEKKGKVSGGGHPSIPTLWEQVHAIGVAKNSEIAGSSWTIEALLKLARKGLAAGMADRVGERGEIVMVDEPLPSRARPDLVQRIPGQGLVVTDTKVTMSHGAKRISDYDTAHQLWHYAWEVGDTLGEPVSWVRVHQVTLTPTRTILHPIRVTPARLAFWLRGATDAWARIAVQGDPAPNWSACVGRYGRCVYTEACHVLDLDTDGMEAVYEKVERVRP